MAYCDDHNSARPTDPTVVLEQVKAAIEQAVGSAVEEALRIDAAIAEVQGSHPAYIRIDKYAPKATRTRAP